MSEPAESQSSEKTSSTGRHLIADDARINRLVLERFLSKRNLKVTECSDGSQVLDAVDQEGEFDIIWLDVKMPIMNGTDCTMALRNRLQYQGIIVGITGNVEPSAMAQYRMVGMNEVLEKPLERSRVYDLVEHYFPGSMQ